MADLNRFVERMRYWCDHANLGYNQQKRWNIVPGGSCDCSSLVIFCLREAGFETGSASYTGDMSENLCKHGWKRIAPNGSPRVGDILLNDNHHVAVCTGINQMSYASIDENGRISGGADGDQTDRETLTVSGFYYSRGWSCYLRYGEQEPARNESNAFPLPRGHWFGKLDMNEDRNHSGFYNSLDRPAIRRIQAVVGAGTDGLYGSETRSKVIAWQRAHGLDDDGEVGVLTWKAIFSD